jgi:hypothetical protein
MSELSNALADLAERVKLANVASAEAERSAIESAMKAGELLCQAKAETAHGQWTPFLERAGVHERQARRLMQLSRSGLKPDTVSDLGGLKATLEWMKDRRLPKAGEVLLVSVDYLNPERREPMVVVWPAIGEPGYHMGKLWPDVCDSTRRPCIGSEADVWALVHSALDHRFAEMTFTIAPDRLDAIEPKWSELATA